MKNILFTFTALCISAFAFAQTNTFPTTGNVGIGTTSPKDKLQIGSTLGLTFHDGGHKALTWNGYYSSGSWKYIGADFTAQLHMDNGSNIFKINVAQAGTADGAITWTNALSIKDNGLVGIGTDSPAHKLQVESTTDNYIRSKSTATNSLAGFSISNDFKEWIMRTDGNDFFQIRDVNNNAQRLVIDPSDGNVGIGTTSPTEKLEVNGTVRTKKVKVSATGWPDYVFSDNYELRDINALEAFIRANKHLPEVPSAEAIEANGLDLGSMDATLLKKVEELTLYLIDQNKKLNEEVRNSKVQDTRLKALETNNLELRMMVLELKKQVEELKKNK